VAATTRTRRKTPSSGRGTAALVADAFAKRGEQPGVALPKAVRLDALVARYGGVLDDGLAKVRVRFVAPIEAATHGDAIAPVLSRKWIAQAKKSAAVLLVDASLAALVPAGRRLVHPSALSAFAAILGEAAPPPSRPTRSLAHVARGARVDSSAVVGPGAVVLAGAIVGPDARIEPNAVVYGGVVLGARVVVGAGAVVGRPGFGWAPGADGLAVRIPQLGGVHVEDDAEIGALATVDAGTLAPTVIGRGAKLDAMVHVGHNARIGPGTIVAAQSGFAGSSRVGAGVLVGGQVGVADHVTVGDGARLAAKAGVIGDVPPGSVVAGYPAVPRGAWLRATARALEGARPRRTGTPTQDEARREPGRDTSGGDEPT
jgi:UDP-3-O-[3-hydroxymyristoyl] glucosamine N-acyltransferase